MLFLSFLVASITSSVVARNNLALTPPMGWMSWEVFRCNLQTATDDCTDPLTTNCISEALYKGQADAMVAGGFVEKGYNSIHMDDCWEEKHPRRDPVTNELVPDRIRFPSGMRALSDYIRERGLGLAMYTAESVITCGGYPASKGYEEIDANTFAKWGSSYLKVDGCGDLNYYAEGYKRMGAALENTGSDIVYSCSWPAYIGNNESEKPFAEMIMDGCNLWRNYGDIQCDWNSLLDIIDHFGDYAEQLAPFAGPGHWHDADMLILGNGCISEDEERTQMAIWSIIASPLIMGNDLRHVPAASREILLNEEAIAVNQDSMGQMGLRLSKSRDDPQQVWARNLANGDVAVALFNKMGNPQPPIPTECDSWDSVSGGYYEACGGADGNVGSFSGLSVEEAQEKCCSDDSCAGFSYNTQTKSGFFKGNAMCGFVSNSNYEGFAKPDQIPNADNSSADVTVLFADLHLFGEVSVRDIWAGEDLGIFTGSYTAKNVPFHGTAFLRLSQK